MGGQKTNSCPSSQQHSWHPFLFQVFLSICLRWKGSSLPFSPAAFSGYFCAARQLQVQGLHCSDKVGPGSSHGMCSPEPQPHLDSSGQATHNRALPPRSPGLGAQRLPQHGCSLLSGELKMHWTVTQPFTAPTDFWGTTPKASSKRRAGQPYLLHQKIAKISPRT